MDVDQLNAIIVKAKTATYAGGGAHGASCRIGSHDLNWSEGDWQYLDSYFGGTDFIGQEAIWLRGEPVWAMNYYGYIQHPQLIDARRAGATIKAALSALYVQGRFLGGFEWTSGQEKYVDKSEGDAAHFHGREVILVNGIEAYALDYFGGLIKA